MAKENLIRTTISNIERFLDEDLSILLHDGPNVQKWNNADTSDLKDMVDELSDSLKKIIEKDLLNDLSLPILTSINNNFTNFFNQFNNIRNLKPEQIRNHHHQPINQINALINVIRTYGIYSIIKLGPDIVEKSELLDKQTILVNSTQDKINKLLNQVENLVSPSVAHSLSNSFDKRKESIIIQKWTWLFIMIISFVVAIWLTYDLTHTLAELIENGSTKSFEENSSKSIVPAFTLILRLIILFPAYYIVFFTISQYKKERKLEEIYAHKSSVAQTLPSYSELVENENVKDTITSNATGIVFELPDENHNNKEGEPKQQYLNEIKESLNYLTKMITNINGN